jgi:predicted TIM-barrel enzyme
VVDLPVLVGSGVGLHNAGDLYERSGGLILGEVDFKLDRRWGGASDADAYKRAVEVCRS